MESIDQRTSQVQSTCHLTSDTLVVNIAAVHLLKYLSTLVQLLLFEVVQGWNKKYIHHPLRQDPRCITAFVRRDLETMKVDMYDDPKLQLAARELSKLKPDDLDRLLKLIAAMKSDDDEKEPNR